MDHGTSAQPVTSARRVHGARTFTEQMRDSSALEQVARDQLHAHRGCTSSALFCPVTSSMRQKPMTAQ